MCEVVWNMLTSLCSCTVWENCSWLCWVVPAAGRNRLVLPTGVLVANLCVNTCLLHLHRRWWSCCKLQSTHPLKRRQTSTALQTCYRLFITYTSSCAVFMSHFSIPVYARLYSTLSSQLLYKTQCHELGKWGWLEGGG